MARGRKAVAADFEREEFAKLNQDAFDAYVELVLIGHHPTVAIKRAFGEEYGGDQYTQERINAIERNPYFAERFKKRLAKVTIPELWDAKVSIRELLQMVRSPFVKDSTRLNAVKELNVLAEITFVDEQGRTRARPKGLDDFYRDEGLQNPPPVPVGDDQAKEAPIPGD